jgi:hypothetical protein
MLIAWEKNINHQMSDGDLNTYGSRTNIALEARKHDVEDLEHFRGCIYRRVDNNVNPLNIVG